MKPELFHLRSFAPYSISVQMCPSKFEIVFGCFNHIVIYIWFWYHKHENWVGPLQDRVQRRESHDCIQKEERNGLLSGLTSRRCPQATLSKGSLEAFCKVSMTKIIKCLSYMDGLETGHTHRKNEFAMQLLHSKRWEVRNGVVSSDCTSPPWGVSDHLFVEDLAKSELLCGGFLSVLFLFTLIISWSSPDAQELKTSKKAKVVQESRVMSVQPSPNMKSWHDWDRHPQKTGRDPEFHSSGMFLCDGYYYCSDRPWSFPFVTR